MSEPAKGQSSLPRVPKEELVDEEEFDRIYEERYANPSRFIKYADEFDNKVNDAYSIHDAVMELMPNIWKVKCTVWYLEHESMTLLTVSQCCFWIS